MAGGGAMGAESVDDRLAAMALRIEELGAQCASADRRLRGDAFDFVKGDDLDTIWLIIGAVGVFSMQSGFAMLEVGSCARDHTKEILLKNINTIS